MSETDSSLNEAINANKSAEAKSIVLLGAGRLAQYVACLLRENGANVTGYYDQDKALLNTIIEGLPVIGTIDQLLNGADRPKLVVAIANLKARQRLFQQFKHQGFDFVSVIHPSALISSSATIGEGTIIREFVVVEMNSRIGENVILNPLVQLRHDSSVGSHTIIGSSAVISPFANVGIACNLGVQTVVEMKTTVGSEVEVAAGCILRENISDKAQVRLEERYIKIT